MRTDFKPKMNFLFLKTAKCFFSMYQTSKKLQDMAFLAGEFTIYSYIQHSFVIKFT